MSHLAQFLENLQTKYHREDLLSSDPLEFVHRYRAAPYSSHDQEVVAFLAALLAYGNVKQIRRSVALALTRMEESGAPTPAAFVRRLDQPSEVAAAERAFRGYAHRFNVGKDLVVLFQLIAKSWKEYGSVGAHFLSKLDPEAPDVTHALNALIFDWRKWIPRGTRPSFQYLLTAPADGSCCKRWCMLLRWMGRKDDLDPGLWGEGSPLSSTFPRGRFLRPAQLVIPLDTHTGRISQYIGLTRRKSLNWKAALEVTASLRECDPGDPTRYDFAISRLGILDICQKKYRAEICESCDLVTRCHFAARSRKKGVKNKT